jgi:integrase
MRAYAAALECATGHAADLPPIGADRTVAGSFDALAVAYYKSEAFASLRASSQRARRFIIEAFRREHGTKPLADLTRGHIRAILGAKQRTPAAANNLLKTLRVLLAFAVDIDLLASNPASGLKGYKQSDGFHSWSEDEVDRFKRRHSHGSKPRLALELLLGTAQRLGDAVKLGQQHVRGDLIAVRQGKTNTALLVPMTADLSAELKRSPKTQLTFLVLENGAPFSPAYFSVWFRDRCREAGLPHCSAHGLRKLAATRLAHAGASASEIAAVTGHKSLGEVARYTKAADQERLARAARAREQTETKNCPTHETIVPPKIEKS